MKKHVLVRRVATWCLVAVLGALAGSAVAPARIQAAGPCEKNECDRGIFWDSCYQVDILTGCQVTGWTSCKTYVCDLE